MKISVPHPTGRQGRAAKRPIAVAVMLGLALCVGGCFGGSEEGGSDGAAVEGASSVGDPVPPVTILGPSPSYDASQNESLKLLVDGMAELGIEASIEGTPDYGTFAEASAAHEYGIASAGYVGTPARLEPSELMGPGFLCDLEETNFAGYCSEAYDEAFAQIQGTMDEDARHDLVDEGQQMLADDLPMVTMYYPSSPEMYNSSLVSGAVLARASGFFNFWTFHDAEPNAADGLLTVGHASRGIPMNPMCNASGGFTELEYQLMIFEPLTRVDKDGAVVNWAADSIEQTDDTTLTVKLRDDLEFTDGKPVTAEDVAFTYNYMKEWKVALYTAILDRIESVRAVDPQTVEFKLTEPYAPFLFQSSQIGIMPKHVWDGVVERENLKTPCEWENPDLTGSGPYKFVEYKPRQRLRLERNDAHFDPPAAKGLVQRYYASTQSLFLDLLAGNVQFHGNAPSFTPTQVEEAEANEDLTVEIVPSITVRWIAFNMRDGSPFQDYPLRKAVSHVIDYPTIVDGLLRGQGEPGAGVISPYNELWHNAEAEWPQYDVEAAKQTLADAGYGWDDSGKLHFPANHTPQEFGDGAGS